MYTVTQIDYLAISKSNTLALVMAASDRGGGQRQKSRVKLCFGRVRGDEGVRRIMGVRKVMLQGEFSVKKSLQMPGLHIFCAYHMLH